MPGSYSIMRSDSVISHESDSISNDNLNPTEHSAHGRAKWTAEEVDKLVSLRAQYPDMSWEVLQETHFPERTVAALKGKIWRLADAEAKTQKRSRSESSTSNEHSYLGDIPYEGVPIVAKARSRKNIGGELAQTPRTGALNTRQAKSTGKRTDTGTQARKPTRSSFPTAASFSTPVNQPAAKKSQKTSVQLLDNDAPFTDADDGSDDNRVQLALQLLDPKLWNQIYCEARKCESERRRANSALREKAALEAEVKDLKSRLLEMDKNATKPKPKLRPSARTDIHQSSMKGLDSHRAQRLKAAWSTVASTCKESISFNNWEAAGMSEAVKVVQGEIDEMTKAMGSETSLSTPSGIANSGELGDNGDSMMGNLRLFSET